MKILLLNPPPLGARQEIVAPPLGLAYIASACEASGRQVQILDAFALGLSFDDLEQELGARKPDLVGVTGMTPIIESAFQSIQIARNYSRHVILGGAHASALGRKVFEECPALDALVVGEAEESFPCLIQAIEDGKGDWSGIPGVITRRESESSKNLDDPERPVIKALDSLPFPARHLLPRNCYRHPLFGGEGVATLISSRGCPYHCIFCDKSVTGSRWRSRSAENVVDEIEEIVSELGISSLIFYDDLFTLNPGRVIEICQGIIERGIRVQWKCEGRVNLVDDEMLAWMKRAGCRIIAYGVETAHQKGLDYLRKGVTREQIEEAFRRTREAGIQTLAYFILGIPVETFKEELLSIRFARELGADYAQFSTLSPFPGSELYQEASEKGWYQERPAFGPGEQGTRRPLLITEEWTEGKLKEIVDRAYRDFYYRPGYILKRLLHTRSLRQLRMNISGMRSTFPTSLER
jgi:anaerobic magnesium-protoporphyrin IX monomethyl ester cyclase